MPWRGTSSVGNGAGPSRRPHPHGCVALLQPPPPWAPTSCIPKGLSVCPEHARPANPPAQDGLGPDATNPCPSVGLLPGDGGGMGAGRKRAPRPALAGHRIRPRSRARSGTGRPPSTSTGRPASAGAHPRATGRPCRAQSPDGSKRGDLTVSAEPEDGGAPLGGSGPAVRGWAQDGRCGPQRRSFAIRGFVVLLASPPGCLLASEVCRGRPKPAVCTSSNAPV